MASVAFGFSNNQETQPWLVGLLPFVSIYVDLLIRQIDLRIEIIAKFLRSKSSGIITDYEEYIGSNDFNKIKPWEFHQISIEISTFLISIFVLVYGITVASPVIQILGGIGSLLTPAVLYTYRKKHAAVFHYKFE